MWEKKRKKNELPFAWWHITDDIQDSFFISEMKAL